MIFCTSVANPQGGGEPRIQGGQLVRRLDAFRRLDAWLDLVDLF